MAFSDDESHPIKKGRFKNSFFRLSVTKSPSPSLYSDEEDVSIFDKKMEKTSSDQGQVNDEDESSDIDESEMSDSSTSSGPVCAICLGMLRGQIGCPDAFHCEHMFCLICIEEWSKNNAVCPQDRRPFERIFVREEVGGVVVNSIPVEYKTGLDAIPIPDDDPTYCEVCKLGDREERLLLCDGCDLGYHLECLFPSLSHVPVEEWFCPLCRDHNIPQTLNDQRSTKPSSSISRKAILPSRSRLIPRTRASERVLERIVQKRKSSESRKKRRQRNHLKRERREEKEMNGTKAPRRDSIVQAFPKPKPFGSKWDDDIDQDYNDTLYAEMSTKFDRPVIRDAEARKKNAYEILQRSFSSPKASYAGRNTIPTIVATSTQNPDVLSSIIDDQNMLLGKSQDFDPKDIVLQPVSSSAHDNDNSTPKSEHENASNSSKTDQDEVSASGEKSVNNILCANFSLNEVPIPDEISHTKENDIYKDCSANRNDDLISPSSESVKPLEIPEDPVYVIIDDDDNLQISVVGEKFGTSQNNCTSRTGKGYSHSPSRFDKKKYDDRTYSQYKYSRDFQTHRRSKERGYNPRSYSKDRYDDHFKNKENELLSKDRGYGQVKNREKYKEPDDKYDRDHAKERKYKDRYFGRESRERENNKSMDKLRLRRSNSRNRPKYDGRRRESSPSYDRKLHRPSSWDRKNHKNELGYQEHGRLRSPEIKQYRSKDYSRSSISPSPVGKKHLKKNTYMSPSPEPKKRKNKDVAQYNFSRSPTPEKKKRKTKDAGYYDRDRSPTPEKKRKFKDMDLRDVFKSPSPEKRKKRKSKDYKDVGNYDHGRSQSPEKKRPKNKDVGNYDHESPSPDKKMFKNKEDRHYGLEESPMHDASQLMAKSDKVASFDRVSKKGKSKKSSWSHNYYSDMFKPSIDGSDTSHSQHTMEMPFRLLKADHSPDLGGLKRLFSPIVERMKAKKSLEEKSRSKKSSISDDDRSSSKVYRRSSVSEEKIKPEKSISRKTSKYSSHSSSNSESLPEVKKVKTKKLKNKIKNKSKSKKQIKIKKQKKKEAKKKKKKVKKRKNISRSRSISSSRSSECKTKKVIKDRTPSPSDSGSGSSSDSQSVAGSHTSKAEQTNEPQSIPAISPLDKNDKYGFDDDLASVLRGEEEDFLLHSPSTPKQPNLVQVEISSITSEHSSRRVEIKSVEKVAEKQPTICLPIVKNKLSSGEAKPSFLATWQDLDPSKNKKSDDRSDEGEIHENLLSNDLSLASLSPKTPSKISNVVQPALSKEISEVIPFLGVTKPLSKLISTPKKVDEKLPLPFFSRKSPKSPLSTEEYSPTKPLYDEDSPSETNSDLDESKEEESLKKSIQNSNKMTEISKPSSDNEAFSPKDGCLYSPTDSISPLPPKLDLSEKISPASNKAVNVNKPYSPSDAFTTYNDSPGNSDASQSPGSIESIPGDVPEPKPYSPSQAFASDSPVSSPEPEKKTQLGPSRLYSPSDTYNDIDDDLPNRENQDENEAYSPIDTFYDKKLAEEDSDNEVNISIGSLPLPKKPTTPPLPKIKKTPENVSVETPSPKPGLNFELLNQYESIIRQMKINREPTKEPTKEPSLDPSQFIGALASMPKAKLGMHLKHEKKKSPNQTATDTNYQDFFGDAVYSDDSLPIPSPDANDMVDSPNSSENSPDISRLLDSHNKSAGSQITKLPLPKVIADIDISNPKIARKIEAIQKRPTKRRKSYEDTTSSQESEESSYTGKLKNNRAILEAKVIDEAKKWLNPYYLDRCFSRQVFKEIVAKIVAKVIGIESSLNVDCHKIQKLVDGYVVLYKHKERKQKLKKSSIRVH